MACLATLRASRHFWRFHGAGYPTLSKSSCSQLTNLWSSLTCINIRLQTTCPFCRRLRWLHILSRPPFASRLSTKSTIGVGCTTPQPAQANACQRTKSIYPEFQLAPKLARPLKTMAVEVESMDGSLKAFSVGIMLLYFDLLPDRLGLLTRKHVIIAG